MSYTLAVPAVEAMVITCEYNPREWDGISTGLAWAILHDNPVMAWLIDPTCTDPVQPVILGSMAGPPPDTSPVVSPAWASISGDTVFVPDTWRGQAMDFFTYVATNAEVHRPIYAKFADNTLAAAWDSWANAHPDLALKEPPNV